MAAKTTKDKDIVQPKAEDLTKTTTSVATLVEKTPVSAANVHPVDKNVVEAISIDYNNKRAIDSLVKMIDGQVDKAKILGHINKNCNSESLKIPVKLEARDVSILEYTISKNAGSKVVGAILTKGNFTTEEIKKAQTRIVDGSTKRSRIANTKKVLNAHSIQAALQHSSSSVVSNKASPPASHALHNIQTTQTR